MTAKEIIDPHFSRYYEYYKNMCYKISRGDGEIYEDLLHLTYESLLKVKLDVLTKFKEIDKLNYIGIRCIKSIYSKRFCKKKYSKNESSPLFVGADEFLRIDKQNNSADDDGGCELMDTIDKTQYTEKDYIILDKAIATLLRNPDTTVGVTIFLQANEVSINKLSRDSKISRYYLTNKYKEGLNNLKTQIQNEQLKTSARNISTCRS